jgi:hypothetical protein
MDMHPAQHAFINEIRAAAAANSRLIARINRGERVFDRDLVDMTTECLADARRRLLDARLILAAV